VSGSHPETSALRALSPLDQLLGLELTRCDDDGVGARMLIEDRHKQVTGVVHGGVYASIVEAVGSLGTNWHVSRAGNVALGMSNATTFLRLTRAGHLHAQGEPLHRGRSATDDDDRLCAIGRLTLAIRPLSDQTP